MPLLQRPIYVARLPRGLTSHWLLSGYGTVLLVISLLCGAPRRNGAQERPGGSDIAAVGSEMENYLRYLQIDGKAPLYPWTVRGFSPAELDRLLTISGHHPWESAFA